MSKYIDMIAWDDCPHLRPPNISEQELQDFELSLSPHQREARRTGRPALGSGAIYPVPESDFIVEPFKIPEHFHRGYALDVGWRKTAALFGAYDPDNQTYYITGEYYQGQKEPIVHAHSIKRMMLWPYNGVIDPAAEGSNQKDGTKLRAEYENLGLNLSRANNAVEAGLHKVLVALQGGQLKVFDTLKNFIKEYRLYRRDEKGKIIKENDHLMDCLRYLLNTDGVFMSKPQATIHKVRQGEW